MALYTQPNQTSKQNTQSSDRTISSDAPLESNLGTKNDRAFELSENAKIILEQRYLLKDEDGASTETPEELFTRVANAIAKGESTLEDQTFWSSEFYNMLTSLDFLPNSPTLVNAGTDGKGCLSACFVVSPEDTMDSIMNVAYDAAMIEKWGGGIGFGLSKLRPKNDSISTTHGQACGPISVMKLYSTVGATLTQGSFRLGAHMGQLSISHPDIKEFIHCKDNDDTLQNFNISVQITDDFMKAVESNDSWDLKNPRDGEIVETINAKELWDEICESAWKTGDPGIVFIERVWDTAPNPQMGYIQTSNPCGEEFLENYGNCCLGSINLDHHITDQGFDWNKLEKTVRTAARFLDDVIEVNQFPLEKLRDVNLATRRIGLGIMGWADALVRLGIPYDSPKALKLADEVGGFINHTAWDASAQLAEERGPFPEYENSALKQKGMPPVRNSSVVTIAPTGTISRLADCSSGIEPHFAIAWWSNVLWKDHEGSSTRLLDAPVSVTETVTESTLDGDIAKSILGTIADNPDKSEDILKENGINPDVFRTSMTISPEAHIKMQSVWQKHVTNSVSKTINLPNESTIEDISNAYKLAWETDCKAVTVYRDGSKSLQVLETGKTDSETSQEDSADQNMLVPRQRPTTIRGITERVRTGHGTMFVTINFDEHDQPFEMFTTLGKAGGCHAADLEAISRLASLALRSGVDPDEMVHQMKGITCCSVWNDGSLIRSDADAVASVLDKYATVKTVPGQNSLDDNDSAQLGLFPSSQPQIKQEERSVVTGAKCPQCSGYVIHQEGCLRCLDCGYTKCE